MSIWATVTALPPARAGMARGRWERQRHHERDGRHDVAEQYTDDLVELELAGEGDHAERGGHEELVGDGIDEAPERRAAEASGERSVKQVGRRGDRQHDPASRSSRRVGSATASGTRTALTRSAAVQLRRPCSSIGRGLVSVTLLLSPAGGRDPSRPGVQDTRRHVRPLMMLDTAVIPCGGLGTRLHPITRWLPKETLPVALRPVLHWTLDEAADAGLLRAIVVTNPHKPMLEAVARSYPGPLDLEFVPQDHPRGLGDALLRARDHLAGSPFVTLLPDNLFHGPNPDVGGPRHSSRHRTGHRAAGRDLPGGGGQQGRDRPRLHSPGGGRDDPGHRDRRQGTGSVRLGGGRTWP